MEGIIFLIIFCIFRRYTTLFSTQLVIYGCVLKIISAKIHFSLFLAGRVFDGFASGSLMVSAVVWLLEIIHPDYVEFYKFSIQIFINIGIFIIKTFQIKYIFHNNWNYTYFISMFSAIILTVFIHFIPESFKFIYSKTKNIAKVEKNLIYLRKSINVQNEIEKLQNETDDTMSFRSFFSTKKYLAATASWSLINLGKQIIGVNYILTFNSNLLYIFEDNFILKQYGLFFISASAFLGSIIFVFLLCI